MSQNKPLHRKNDVFRLTYLHPKYWLLWIAIGLTYACSILPYRWILKLGRCLGRICYHIARKRVHIARVNLQKCFPKLNPTENESLLKRHMESVGIGIMELAMAWWWPAGRLEKLVSYQGLDNLDSDSGNILIVIHFTTIELAGKLITLHHSLDAVYREHGNPVLEYVQRHRRLQFDPKGQLLGRYDIWGMIRSLRKGNTLFYSPDQDYGVANAQFVPFFGIPAATMTSTSRLAKAGKAKVLTMSVTRLPDAQGYQICISPPLSGIPSDDEYQDTVMLNQIFEQQITEHPEQYMWVHRRFKTRPDGEKDFYK